MLTGGVPPASNANLGLNFTYTEHHSPQIADMMQTDATPLLLQRKPAGMTIRPFKAMYACLEMYMEAMQQAPI